MGVVDVTAQVVPVSILKSAGFCPPIAPTLKILRGPLPIFKSVTVLGALVIPTGWVPKLALAKATTEEDENEAWGVRTPFPVRFTRRGLPVPLSAMVRVAVRVPVVVGVNTMATAHVPP